MHADAIRAIPAPTLVAPERLVTSSPNRLYAIVDTPAALDSVLAALGAQPCGPRPHVMACDVGRRRIGARSERAALLGRLVPVSGFGVGVEHAPRYDAALKAGRYVVELHVPDASTRARSVALLRANGGHFIAYYGPLAVEVLVP